MIGRLREVGRIGSETDGEIDRVAGLRRTVLAYPAQISSGTVSRRLAIQR